MKGQAWTAPKRKAPTRRLRLSRITTYNGDEKLTLSTHVHQAETLVRRFFCPEVLIMIRAGMGLLGLLSAAGLLVLLAPGTSEAQVRIGVSVGGGRGGLGYYGGYAPYYRGYGYPGTYGYAYPGAYGYGRSGFSIGISTAPYYYPGYA